MHAGAVRLFRAVTHVSYSRASCYGTVLHQSSVLMLVSRISALIGPSPGAFSSFSVSMVSARRSAGKDRLFRNDSLAADLVNYI